MKKSNLTEKKDIYVPAWVGKRLEDDAESFEIYKNDGKSLNMNRFLRLLIVGYYNDYLETNLNKKNSIYTLLIQNNIAIKTADDLSELILKDVILTPIPTRKGKNPKKLSLKPSKDMATLMMSINKNLGPDDSLSQYLCKMFTSYCSLPFSDRERIIFKDLFEDLDRCVSPEKAGSKIVTLRTIWNPEKVHTVIPYKITAGKEERYNYLLCSEIYGTHQQTSSYRINRITDIEVIDSGTIEPQIRDNLEKMLINGVNYRIRNDDQKAVVRLTNKGNIEYKKIYTGRPIPYDIKENGDCYDYYFDCSNEQLYLYFRRFGKEAEIISPIPLRERIKSFYFSANEVYQKETD